MTLEREIRTRLVDVEIELDARRRWPLRRDLGWNRARITVLTVEAARLRRQIATVKALGSTA